MGSPYVRKGLEGHKNTGFVLKFVKFEQDSKGYVVCEDDLRGGVQEDDSLTMVTRTEDANFGRAIRGQLCVYIVDGREG